MSKGVELDSQIEDVIQRTLITEEDVKNAKKYFKGTTVNDMIDSVVAIEE